MNTKHRRTLSAIFSRPTSPSTVLAGRIHGIRDIISFHGAKGQV
jgi:hypothetical protein